MVVKFRRKSTPSHRGEPSASSDHRILPDERPVPAAPEIGPYDIDSVPDGLIQDDWVDLGSMMLAPAPGKELRLQVDEASGQIAAVMLTAEDGAMELRAFAAPRDGDLWNESLPLLREDVQQRGGATADLQGPWGDELITQMKVKLPDGQPAVQQTRIIGINGPRWMLRATLLGRPAMEPSAGKEWEQLLERVVVRRGNEAKPKGEALEVKLPPNARPVEK
ncbi:DUF3710 domain-containing protein [Nocardioides luteus]|uniref:DUF3710 domain-containing protein n=1 Tax=Nocardioides luteus TaxID=1844 RepID=A0ABQ5SZ18_9ACTN|nr:DUF3710 domain-containing protein [Nocardioides luteus]GGR40622.1 hypothetical protein GCM10010197_02060 [Nocardioides luteus]GLJ69430.1 hypothetical protein GCM10017579_34660 [Nocardioides luteus]